MSTAQEVKPEAVPDAPAAEQVDAQPEAVEEQQPTVPPVVVRLPQPHNARTLPKPAGDESYSQLTLLSQPTESVQELKIAISEWIAGYWLGPYSLRLPGKPADVLSVSKEGVEIRAGEKLSEWLEVGDVFAHVPEDGTRELEVVKEPYTESAARLAVTRLLDYIEPAGTTVHTLTTPLGVAPGSTIFESVRDGLLSGETEAAAAEEAEKKRKGKKEGDEETKEKNAFSTWTTDQAVPLSQLPVSQAPVQVQPCLRAIQLSPFNPPPAHLRQQGHQLYLQVNILEGDVYTLVCTSRGWYASKSNVNNFDPTPRDASAAPVHSLIDLLHSLSPLFSERLFALPALSATPPTLDPLSTLAIPQAEPSYPWLISAPKPDTTPDVLRTQLAYLHTGATSPDALDSARDWNEEIQGIKELPHSNMQERVFRERMAQKTWSEFTQASLRAVLAVARGDVIALNPNEPARSHMWLTSNIFVTKAIDSIDAYAHIGGDAAAHVSHAKDAEGVRLLNRLDVDGVNLLGHTVVDWQGERWVCQSVLPGIFSRQQATPTAAVDGDKKEDWVKVDDAEGTEEPAATNPLIIYGVDSEQTSTIHWDKATHEVMEKIAAHQRLAPHKVSAGDAEHEFFASSEVKGLRGSDGRRYLLDLPRLNPVDVEFLEKDYAGKLAGPEKDVDAPTYLHRMTLLRAELVELFWESELKRWARKIAEEQAAKKKAEEEAKGGKEDVKEGETKEEAKEEPKLDEIDPSAIATLKDFELRFNPDAFVDSAPETGAEGFGPSKFTDETDPAIKAVRDASVFLRTIAVPAIALDVLTGSVSGIMDGISLTRHMHARGINMRYLGLLTATIDSFSKGPEGESREASGNLAALKDIVLHEMVFRSAKHVLRRLVRDLLPEQVPAAVSHFLNCLLGTALNTSPSAVFDRNDIGDSTEPAYVELTPQALRREIIAEAEARFRWRLDEAFLTSGLRRPQLLRELAQRFAFQVVQRDYAFERSAEPAGDSDKEARAIAAKKGKKGGKAAPAKRTTTFEPADILTLVPVVRSTAPAVSVAEEIFEAGRSTINRGQVDMGLEFMLEGIQLYESIHTVIHPEVAAAYNQYSSTLHQLARIKIQQLAQQENANPEEPLGLDIATGLRLQRQAVIIAERTLGVYHPDTLAYYFQLAMLENLEGNSQASLRYFRHILLLWEVMYGPNHPEINTILSNAGIVLQALNEHPQSIALLEESAKRTAKQFGDKHTSYGAALHQLTQAHFLGGDFNKALAASTAAHEIFKAAYGEDNAQTKEVAKNAELLKAVVDNVERNNAAQEQIKKQQLERLAAAQSAATVPAPTTGRKQRGINGGVPTAAQVQAAAAQIQAAAAAVAAAKAGTTEGAEGAAAGNNIGEHGHLDVDELVKYIQGNTPAKAPSRGKNALRGKRRTGAKR